jgi:sugar phosphate permease
MLFKTRNLSYAIWACAALFYVFQFILRISPGLMIDDLMLAFQIDATRVAQLSAVAMYSYSLLQIPTGLLADTFGVRKVLLSSILLCILGISVFALSPDLFLAKFGRLLLGAGSAAAFLCVGKVSTLWFSPDRRSTLLGLTMAIGTIGASLGSTPLAYLIAKIGWRNSLLSTCVLGAIVFGLSYFLVPNRKQELEQNIDLEESQSLQSILSHLKTLLRLKYFWIYSFTALGVYLCMSVMADLWGVSFVMQTYGVEKTVASQMVSLIYIGLCIGSLVLTFLADYFKIRLLLIQVSIFSILFLTASLFYWLHLPLLAVSAILFLIGFFAGAEMLCFASLCEIVDPSITGTATGFMNCIVMLGGAFIAEQVGRVLDLFWKGELHTSGIRLYSVTEYQISLSMVVAAIFLSAITAVFLPKRAAAN